MIGLIVVLLVLIVVIVSLFAYVRSQLAIKYWQKNGIPTPKEDGFLKIILKRKFDLVPAELDIYRKVRETKIGGIAEFTNPVLYVADLDLMKKVLIKDFDHFVDRRTFDAKEHDPHMYWTLVNQCGEAWKGLRMTMTPTFTTGKIRMMYQIFDSSSTKLVQAISKALEQSGNNILEISTIVSKFSMDVIASAAFGIDTNCFENADKSPFVQLAKKFEFRLNLRLIMKLFTISISPGLAKLLKLRIIDAEADAFFSRIIKQNLKRRIENKEKREDFLQLMLDARQGNLKQEVDSEMDAFERNAQLKDVKGFKSKIEITDDVIIAQAFLFYLAGQDNLEATITFTLYELALNPEIQEKLHGTLADALKTNCGKFSYELINSVEYLDMVISESLRKYPPATRTERRCILDYPMPDMDYVLPKGILVAVPIYAVHHDPAYYPNPDKFDPERFTKENVASRHPMTYIPFGEGPRSCIAKRFALVAVKTAIARLVLEFEFEPCAKTSIPIKFGNRSPLKPVDNTPLAVKLRHK